VVAGRTWHDLALVLAGFIQQGVTGMSVGTIAAATSP
jgi:hypothetical protein